MSTRNIDCLKISLKFLYDSMIKKIILTKLSSKKIPQKSFSFVVVLIVLAHHSLRDLFSIVLLGL